MGRKESSGSKPYQLLLLSNILTVHDPMIKKYYEEQISNEQDVVGYFQTTPDYAELERNLVCKNMDLCLLSKIITQIDELFLLIIEKLYENRISATDFIAEVIQAI